MRVVVIGRTGHIGSYLTPLLVDRLEEEQDGAFGGTIAQLSADAVIDLITELLTNQ